MKPNDRYKDLPKRFWALVRLTGEDCGYTIRGKQKVKIPRKDEVIRALVDRQLEPNCLDLPICGDKQMWDVLIDYLTYRAEVLNEFVQPQLMDAATAKKQFNNLRPSGFSMGTHYRLWLTL